MLEALAIDPRAMTLVPREICEKHRVVPLFGGARLLLAMADATDVTAIHDTVLATGLEVEPVWPTKGSSSSCLRGTSSATRAASATWSAPSTLTKGRLREALAATVRDRWIRHFAVRKAIQVVRGMPEMTTLYAEDTCTAASSSRSSR